MAYFERNGFRAASLDECAISIERELGEIDFSVKDDKERSQKATNEPQSMELHPFDGKYQENETKEATVFYGKEHSVKGEWVESLFLKRIEDHISAEPRDLSWFLDNARIVTVKVLQSLAFLIKELITISNTHAIDNQTFSTIATLFSMLEGSRSFISLPNHFPYKQLVMDLNNQLQRILKANSQSRVVRLKFSATKRAILIATRYEIGIQVGQADFSSVEKFLTNQH